MLRTILPLVVVLGACGSSSEAPSASPSAGGPQHCDSEQIRMLAGKHDFMPAFSPCGGNNFHDFAWSPDGVHLYFSLARTAHVMNAGSDGRETVTVPVGTPVGRAGWLTTSRVAVPARQRDGEGEQIAVYDVQQSSLTFQPLTGFREVDEVQRGADASDVLFSAITDDDDVRRVYRLDLDRGTAAPALPWLEEGVDAFHWNEGQGQVVLTQGQTVALHQVEDGEKLGEWSARRGVLHNEGRWLALEYEGEKVSVFGEGGTRQALPDWAPEQVHRPMLGMVDLESGDRWEFTTFHGRRFQWYQARDYYASHILWGFEGRAVNRNVVLGDLANRLEALEQREAPYGVEPYDG